MSVECLFCGEPELVDVFEVWSDREFMIETCCEALHAHVVDEMQDPQVARRILQGAGLEELLGRELRSVPGVDGQLLLDWKLEVAEITFADACAFIAEHHEHNVAPRGWKFGAGLYNGRELVAVVTVGRPVARAYNGRGVLEVNRLCVRRDLDAAFTRHACSKLYAWAAREAKRRGAAHLITYTLETEPGTSLEAAGWSREAFVRGRSWHTARRPRTDTTGAQRLNKTRWGKALRRAA